MVSWSITGWSRINRITTIKFSISWMKKKLYMWKNYKWIIDLNKKIKIICFNNDKVMNKFCKLNFNNSSQSDLHNI